MLKAHADQTKNSRLSHPQLTAKKKKLKTNKEIKNTKNQKPKTRKHEEAMKKQPQRQQKHGRVRALITCHHTIKMRS